MSKVQKPAPSKGLHQSLYQSVVFSLIFISVVLRVSLNPKVELESTELCNVVCSIEEIHTSSYTESSNFYARYLFGNKKANGIKIAHYNKDPGFLWSKKNEI